MKPASYLSKTWLLFIIIKCSKCSYHTQVCCVLFGVLLGYIFSRRQTITVKSCWQLPYELRSHSSSHFFLQKHNPIHADFIRLKGFSSHTCDSLDSPKAWLSEQAVLHQIAVCKWKQGSLGKDYGNNGFVHWVQYLLTHKWCSCIFDV